MLRSPLSRILYPLGIALLASVGVAFFLRDVKPRPAPSSVPHRTPQLVSRFSDAYQVERSIGPSGEIYTLSHYQTLSASTPEGGELWSTMLPDKQVHGEGGDAVQGIAVTSSFIYATSQGGVLYGVEPGEGKVVWKHALYTPREQQIISGKIRDDEHRPSCSDPKAGPTGDCYVLLRSHVVCYTAQGKQRYSCELRGPGETALFKDLQVGYDGTVFVATQGMNGLPGNLRAVAPTGELIWQNPLEGWRYHVSPHSELVIDQVGEMQTGQLIAYDYNWNRQWEAEVSVRAIDFDHAGNTYCLTWDGHVMALGPGGDTLWSEPTTADIELVAAGTGPVYVLDQMKALVTAHDRITGKKLWDATPADGDKAAAIEAQARENGEVAEYKGYAVPGVEPERYPYAITYLMVSPKGRAYFYGTGNWLFAVGP